MSNQDGRLGTVLDVVHDSILAHKYPGGVVYEYPRPAMTVDTVCFDIDPTERVVRVLTIERLGEPFKGCRALPGGYVNIDERCITAAVRELEEETSLRTLEQYLLPIGLYDEVDRNPLGRVLGMAYWTLNPELNDLNRGRKAKAADDAADARWVEISKILTGEIMMAFDHQKIINDAYDELLKTYNGIENLFPCEN